MTQQRWLERAKETYKFHKAKCVINPKWTINETAISLKRSFGSVCEDLKIASWLKTHSKQIESFDYACDALAFIRKKSREIDLSDIE